MIKKETTTVSNINILTERRFLPKLLAAKLIESTQHTIEII
jgi:hypothetical protein